MNLFRYYVNLRRELMAEISNVKNSESLLLWDNTRSNYSTQNSLKAIHNKYVSAAQLYGYYVVTRYSNCPNHDDYYIDNPFSLSIVYKDTRYNWPESQFYQGERFCKCPCSENNDMASHRVIEDVVFSKSADQVTCDALDSILCDVYSAIENAKDTRSRSSIREFLLRAIIKINDQILPVSMDKYIDHHVSLLEGEIGS